jgi:hypothetical protein
MRTTLARSSALGAFFVAVALIVTACGGSSLPGNAVVKIDDTTITKDAFDHWMAVAAKSQAQQTGASSTAGIVAPVPPDFTACVEQLRKTSKPAKGQPSPTTEPDWDSKLSPGGTGLRVFHPLVIALAAGANFVARAFSGDPNGTADIIAQAISHPGFSFVEVLSPCVTFRPEQRSWKEQVHAAPVAPTDDAARAARRIMTDDGFNIGVLYAGQRAPYPPPRTPASASLQDLEAEFAL